ncbi:hypothetical protein DK419_14605 [Methylobacterium terrae]|uniref:Curlin associated repeat-containing protein n=1 Tax=Methylobacterium terrae TaxID=2202827 RepID=A0A2U8WMA4_9HYPH|nr:hypothetical protein [Methylobacterium terrae]AWN47395.1 hypothetical protein DK419_14605 [Methylobacterium terrae]
MKKHLLALAAGTATLVLATSAFAQSNTAFTSQRDSNNVMDITQSGSGGFVGFSDGQRVDQRGGSGNSLVVRQSGANNVVGATDYNTAQQVLDGAQNGSANTLRIDQSGSGNGVRYSQFGNNNGNLTAGSSNGANNLGPYGGTGFQSPFGGGNNHGGAAGDVARWDYVRQEGTGDQLAIKQDSRDASGANGVISRQNSTASRISLEQLATSSGNNYAYFIQNGGSGNTAAVQQTNLGNVFNLADIRQGDGYVGRSTTASTVNATQSGSALDLFVNQSGQWNQATTSQEVASNTISIFQAGIGYDDLTANKVDASQLSGSGNYLYGYQDGYANSILSRQDGNNNFGYITQIGNSNNVTNRQSGDNHQLIALQVGTGLIVDSTQNGSGQYASIDQNGYNNSYTGLQSGTSNQAYVSQGQNGNIANVVQAGSGNLATIRQNR